MPSIRGEGGSTNKVGRFSLKSRLRPPVCSDAHYYSLSPSDPIIPASSVSLQQLDEDLEVGKAREGKKEEEEGGGGGREGEAGGSLNFLDVEHEKQRRSCSALPPSCSAAQI